ncbi:MAG: sigma-70 family RNA polymerase sigma factor [Phycisphaerae bacterium]
MLPAGLDATLQRARRRDPEALAALVDAYGRRVYGLLFRLTGSRDTADDLLQETFLRVVRTIESYEHDGRFESWLFRIAANLARDHARCGRRRGASRSLSRLDEESDVRGIELPACNTTQPGAELVHAEAGERLQRCLDRLPESDREIILLRHFAELPFREIAEMLGVPLGTALARAHRALERLRRDMGDDGET